MCLRDNDEHFILAFDRSVANCISFTDYRITDRLNYLKLWIKNRLIQYLGSSRQATKTQRNMYAKHIKTHGAPYASNVALIMWFENRETLL